MNFIRTISAIVYFIGQSASMLNLFVAKDEMNRTLGLSAELNYIENGTINTYSTQFPYRIKTNITHIRFSWNTNVMDRKIQYEMEVSVDNSAVLPMVHIPLQGYLPTKTETFDIEYRCAGSKAGKFMVRLGFNFTWPSPNNPTYLQIKHEKLCTILFARGFPVTDAEYQVHAGLDNDDSRQNGSILYINLTYFFIGTIGAIIIVLAAFAYLKSSKKFSNLRDISLNQDRKFEELAVPLAAENLAPTKNNAKSSASIQAASTSKCMNKSKQLICSINSLQELYADRNLFQIHSNNELDGTFGEMKRAIWMQNQDNICGDIDDEEDRACEDNAIIAKTLKIGTDRSEVERLIRDVLVYHRMPPHPNFAKVLAIASFGKLNDMGNIIDNPLICYEHSGFGNLKKFLERCQTTRNESNGNEETIIQILETCDIVLMGIQLANAVIHIHDQGILHKDIATRNCFVSKMNGKSNRLFVQLSDAGLSRDFFPQDYHIAGSGESKPIKWMAYEALKFDYCNAATDLWSLAVTIWELSSCGRQPFEAIDPENVQTHLEQGGILSQPYKCPDELFSILLSCWQLEPDNRLTSKQLLTSLKQLCSQVNEVD